MIVCEGGTDTMLISPSPFELLLHSETDFIKVKFNLIESKTEV